MTTEIIIRIIFTGIGATFCMDFWAIILKGIFGVRPLDYALVGRWLSGMLKGKFRHQKITDSPPVRGEKIIGWISHYAIGVLFASLPLFLSGASWFLNPKPGIALLSGLLSLTAPFLIMQPALGFGIASANVPSSARARLFSICAHSVFGLGLYITAKALSGIEADEVHTKEVLHLTRYVVDCF